MRVADVCPTRIEPQRRRETEERKDEKAWHILRRVPFIGQAARRGVRQLRVSAGTSTFYAIQSFHRGPPGGDAMGLLLSGGERSGWGSGSGPRSKKRQAGAEMVETIITLLFFFIVLLMIIEFGTLIFNKGALLEASRVGARQGSLFWINPDNNAANCPYIENQAPANNVCMKEAMIVSAVNSWRNIALMKFGPGTGTINAQSAGAGDVFGHGSATGGIFENVAGNTATVDLCYPSHDFRSCSLRPEQCHRVHRRKRRFAAPIHPGRRH